MKKNHSHSTKIWPRPGKEGRGKCSSGEDSGDAWTLSCPGGATPYHYQSQCTSPRTENMVRDAGICQGREGHLLLPW
nr:hypothetical protein [Methanobacterium formicicum]